MPSITLKKSANYKEIELAYQNIIENPLIELRLPNSLKERGIFGLEGLVLLLIATWLRKNEKNRIIHSFSRTQSDFDELCGSLYGICALRLSDIILLEKRNAVPREIALKTAYQRIKKVLSEDYKNAFKGAYLAIPSIKAPGKNAEFNNPLYNGSEVVGKDKFLEITKKAIDTVIPQAGRREILSNERIIHISEIIRELFTNTHKHARKDCKGNVLQENFRAIIFNSIDVSHGRLIKLIRSGGSQIANFGAEWLPDEGGKLSVLDLTVVDSGPGYARHWRNEHGAEIKSFNDEAEAIYECFSKHKSKDSKDSSGSGLTNVLNDLRDLKGWFRLRTGRSLIERSFFFDEDNDTSIELADIVSKKNFIEGVSFNVVIPLRKSRGNK